jgi:protein TonB
MAFDAFLNQEKIYKPRGRRITYTVSIGAHVLVVLVMLVRSFWHVEELTPPTVSVTFMSAPPPPPPPPPPPKKSGSKKKPKVIKEIVQPKPEQIVQPKEEPEPEEEEEEEEGAVEGGVEGGVAGGVVGGVVGGTLGATGPVEAPKFVPPNVGEAQRVSFIKPQRPPTLRAMVEFVLVKVCVTKEGGIKDVTLVGGKADDLTKKACVDAAKQWKYKPYTVAGNAVPFCHVARLNFVPGN